MPIEFRLLGPGDDATLARTGDDLFDDPIDAAGTAAFLGDPRHHLAVAIEDGVVVGFVSAVHYAHPDKPGPELWINEVGVASTHRGRGIGGGVMQAMLAHASRLGCIEAWVLTTRDNAEAMRLYRRCGGLEVSPETVMFAFHLDDAEFTDAEVPPPA